MSMDKPFRIEVVVDAPRDAVWREMTEVDRIKHWFSWEYDGLADEIEFIFVKHSVLRPPDRIDFTVDGGFELEELDENRTLIRVTKPATPPPPSGATSTVASRRAGSPSSTSSATGCCGRRAASGGCSCWSGSCPRCRTCPARRGTPAAGSAAPTSRAHLSWSAPSPRRRRCCS